MSESDDAFKFPNRTTPTWEVELLISGVAVFAMLQLPGWLDDRMFAMEPRVDDDWWSIVTLAYIYAKSAALILATSFVLHLLLRARWIALVGMHSVYPEGIRWDKLRLGPVQQDIERHLDRPMPDRIERADNLATTVFAIGVMLVLMIAGIAVVAIATYGAGMLATTLTHGWISAEKAMIAIFSLAMLPYSALMLLDRYASARLTVGSWPYRIARWVLLGYSKFGFSRSGNPIMALLASHGGDRKAILLTSTLMFVALLSVALSLPVLQDPEVLGNYAGFPRRDEARLDPAHYDDQRDPLRDDATPYVQAMAITGPYLKLVVPYNPRRDARPMRKCAVPADSDVAQRDATLLRCLQVIRSVKLDGKPMTDLHYEAASDPRSDRPALLAMIDIRDLSTGRHELRIARPLRTDRKRGKDTPDPGYDQIAFWK